MEFKEYLISKKIDPEAFKKNEPDQYQDFVKLFGKMHPDSFTMQKLFLINGIRRTFPLPEEKWASAKQTPSKPAKPVVRKPAAAAGAKPAKPVVKKPDMSSGEKTTKPVVKKTDNSSGAKPKFRPKPIIKKK